MAYAFPASGGSSFSPLTTQMFYDDFMSFEQGIWSLNNTGSGNAGKSTSGVSNHPGIWTLNTGTDTTGAQNVHLTESGLLLDSGTITLEWVIKIPTLSDGSNRFTIRCGALDNFAPAEGTNAVEFRYIDNVNSGNWVMVTRNGGSETATNTATAVGTGWTRLTIILTPLTPLATFYVGGVSVGTITTNIPTTNVVGLQTQIVKSVGTTSRSVLCDYGYILNTLPASR